MLPQQTKKEQRMRKLFIFLSILLVFAGAAEASPTPPDIREVLNGNTSSIQGHWIKPEIMLLTQGTFPDELEQLESMNLVPSGAGVLEYMTCVLYFKILQLPEGTGKNIPTDEGMRKYLLLDDELTLIPEDEFPSLIEPWTCSFRK